MNTIPLELIQEKYFINKPTYLDERYIILSPDIPVSKELLNRLAKWGYKGVQSDGRTVTTPATSVLDGVAFTEQGYKESEKQREAAQFLAGQVEDLNKVFERFRTKDELKIAEVTEIVKNIIQELKTGKRYILGLSEKEVDTKNFIVKNSIRTAIYALCMTVTSKFPIHKQIDVGIAALLHEIGMLRLPLNLVEKTGALTPEERRLLQAHPVLAFRILKEAEFPGPVATAVLEHHEHSDGSGYPRKLVNDKITPYGKILGVASAYNAAISPRSYKTALDAHTGLMDLLKDRHVKYDDATLKLLVMSLSLYPIGTFVLMSDGSQGIVVKTAENGPQNPVIKLLRDKDGNNIPEQPVVQTREEDEVKILRSLSREESDGLPNPLTTAAD